VFQLFGFVTACSFSCYVVAPPSLSISRERIEDSLIVNQNLTLTCTALLQSQYVDTSVAVVFIWTGPRGVLPMTTQQAYMSTVTVSQLQTNDSGTYTCNAAVSPTLSSPFIVTSSNGTHMVNIMVVGKTQAMDVLSTFVYITASSNTTSVLNIMVVGKTQLPQSQAE